MTAQGSGAIGAHARVRVHRIRVAGRPLVAKSATGRRRSGCDARLSCSATSSSSASSG